MITRICSILVDFSVLHVVSVEWQFGRGERFKGRGRKDLLRRPGRHLAVTTIQPRSVHQVGMDSNSHSRPRQIAIRPSGPRPVQLNSPCSRHSAPPRDEAMSAILWKVEVRQPVPCFA